MHRNYDEKSSFVQTTWVPLILNNTTHALSFVIASTYHLNIYVSTNNNQVFRSSSIIPTSENQGKVDPHASTKAIQKTRNHPQIATR